MKKRHTSYLLSSRKKAMLLIMRTFIFFCCSLAFGFAPKNIFSQNEIIIIKQSNDVTVDEVFQEIKKQTDYTFIYKSDLFANHAKVKLQKGEIRLNELLQKSINVNNFDFDLDNGVITIKPILIKQESFTVEGVVKDEAGEPLPGATVYTSSQAPDLISGNKQFFVKGTTTDFDGNFKIKASLEQYLIVQFIGYESFVEKITTKDKNYSIVLKQSSDKLDEVVVVGYGTQKREEVTSAISTVKNVDYKKNAVGITSFDKALGGLIKGIRITESSGRLGAGVDINIRGVTSPFSDGDDNPLFVIDGVPFQVSPATTYRDETFFATSSNPLLSMNPEDIESIDVLKDASATAIYGSRGANGVIIVKTKKGKRDERVNVELTTNTTFATPIRTYDYLNTEEWKSWNDQVFKNTVQFANNSTALSSSVFNNYSEMIDFTVDPISDAVTYNGLKSNHFGTADTNWADEVFRKVSLAHKYNLTVSGGSKKLNYFFGLSHMNMEGLLHNEKLKQYNFRASMDADLSEKIKVGYTFNAGNSLNESGYEGYSNNISGQLNARPDFTARDQNGNYVRLPGVDFWGTPILAANPLAKFTEYDIETRGLTILGNIYATAKLFKDFNLRYDLSGSRFNSEAQSFTPASVVYDSYPNYTYQSFGSESSVISSYLTSSLTANYNKKIDNHNIGIMLGLSEERSLQDRKYIYGTGFPDDFVLTNITNAETINGNSSKIKAGLSSLFARATYSYNNKYFLTANFRTDRSTKFGPENQRGYFPSVSASWNIARENFLKDVKSIDYIRLRSGYGRTGSNNVGDFEYVQFFTQGYRTARLYNGRAAIGLTDYLPNRNSRWETSDELNLGTDFSLFNYRLTGSLDLYNKKTKGGLMSAPFPLESGASTFIDNFVEMSNKGFEFEIGGYPIKKKDFSWYLKMNLSKNINTLDKFFRSGVNSFQSRYYREGREVDLILGYKVEKIFQVADQAEIDQLNANAPDGLYQTAGTAPGDYKYVDTNGDGEITPDDAVYLGSSQPDLFGGFNTTISYKNFELSSFFSFSTGAEAYIYNESLAPNPYNNTLRRFANDRWTPDNPNARYPRAVLTDPNGNSQSSVNDYITNDRLVYDTSYLRLKNIQLSYALPEKLSEKIGVSKALIFVGGSNIATWTSFPGIDPESMSTGTIWGSNSYSLDPYPIAKSWSLGLNVKF